MNTLVSIYPFPIREFKPGLFPSQFNLEPGSVDDPQFLEVGEAFYYRYAGDGEYIPIPLNENELAESIVSDFCKTSIEYADNGRPGLFWVEGSFDLENPEHQQAVVIAYEQQKEWFERLIQLADADWARMQDPRHISDVQRRAAKEFGLDKPWALQPSKDTQTCEMCGTTSKAFAVLCPQCGYILNEEKYEANKHRFVGAPKVTPMLNVT